MAKGMALTIGLNRVDPGRYAGWDGALQACENHARDLAEIARGRGFEVITLLTPEATREKVLAGLGAAAAQLQAGDLFMLAYSGHGGQLPDYNDDEIDAMDETWCLYDAELVDDEIFASLAGFAAGVRILVLSDSCHSGTVVKAALNQPVLALEAARGDCPRYKFMPEAKAAQAYRANKAFYDAILRDPKLGQDRKEIKAAVILISGCLDNQYSRDGVFNSLFTAHLLRVWHEGAFTGSIKTFHEKIVAVMPPTQTPNYLLMGPFNRAFEEQVPFTI
jgi:metacaspase-1